MARGRRCKLAAPPHYHAGQGIRLSTPKPPVSQGLGYLGSLGESVTADLVASEDCLRRVSLGKPDEALSPGT